MNPMRRLTILLTGLAVVLTLAACNRGGGATAVTSDDMSLGNANAPVTVIEYASASCPHCARWNNDVFPQFKARYIDTGRVHYVFREYLTEPRAVAAAGFLLARCAGRDRYFQVLDAIYRAQESMYNSGDFHGGLLRIAQSAGLTEPQFNACVSDEAATAALNRRVETYEREAHITGTPTFVINGRTLDGEQTMAQLDAAIAQASGHPAPAATNAAAPAATNTAPAATNTAAAH
jgi:protein-disulfide isomerase